MRGVFIVCVEFTFVTARIYRYRYWPRILLYLHCIERFCQNESSSLSVGKDYTEFCTGDNDIDVKASRVHCLPARILTIIWMDREKGQRFIRIECCGCRGSSIATVLWLVTHLDRNDWMLLLPLSGAAAISMYPCVTTRNQTLKGDKLDILCMRNGVRQVYGLLWSIASTNTLRHLRPGRIIQHEQR